MRAVYWSDFETENMSTRETPRRVGESVEMCYTFNFDIFNILFDINAPERMRVFQTHSQVYTCRFFLLKSIL